MHLTLTVCVWLRCDSINAWGRIGERQREGERKVKEAGEEAGSVRSRMDYERKGERGKVPQEGSIFYICLFGIHFPCCLSEGWMVCTWWWWKLEVMESTHTQKKTTKKHKPTQTGSGSSGLQQEIPLQLFCWLRPPSEKECNVYGVCVIWGLVRAAFAQAITLQLWETPVSKWSNTSKSNKQGVTLLTCNCSQNKNTSINVTSHDFHLGCQSHIFLE